MRRNKPFLTKPDIDWLLDSMKLVFPTKEEFDKKVDKVNGKLDTFIGEIKGYREEQILHQTQHDRVDRRLERVEGKLSLTPLAD